VGLLAKQQVMGSYDLKGIYFYIIASLKKRVEASINTTILMYEKP